MSSEERKRILTMLENGTINADQAMTLIKAIEADAAADAESTSQDEPFETEPGPGPARSAFPELDKAAAQARRLSQIPFWAGSLLVLLTVWGMYAILQSAGYNFWFYCLGSVLLLGVIVTLLGTWSRTARWLFVRVQNLHSDGRPRNILLGFPLPLELSGWFLRIFGKHIDRLEHTSVDEVVQAISLMKNIEEPLIVNVHEDNGGERVQVYIG
jgi:hypothetical protein